MINKSIQSLLFVIGLLITPSLLADVIKSENDTREYRVIELDNSLQALLISDLESDKGAASMNIQVGSNANPKDREGLAHFLEHMLFLGTEKYPEADSYQKFIDGNGGSHNAFTAYENTNYFFDIKADALPEALDRFSQFFIAPLFTPEYADRERNAVHSEFESKRLEDGRRIYVANKLAMNPEHNWTQFAVGNLETLRNDPKDPIESDLIDFFDRYYSANLMTLAVSAPMPLDEIEALVVNKFSAIKNSNATPFQDGVPLYTAKQLGKQLDVKTLKELNQLQLTFAIDPRKSQWRTKPLYFIANQLGYEGRGSLLSYLKDQGWAESLGAYVGMDQPEQATFDINLALTPKGMAEYQTVISSVFSAIELIRQQGLKPELYLEQQKLAEIDFRFQQGGEPIHQVMRLSQMLAEYPKEELLRAPYLFDRFEADRINNYLNQLIPENLLIGRYSNSLETDSIEPRYQIEYQIKDISNEQKALWGSAGLIDELSIKPLNPYVATNFELLPAQVSDSEIPELIIENSLISSWYLQDNQFKQPRGGINLAILSPNAINSAKASVSNKLLTAMLNEQLNEPLYDAALAGLGAELYSHMRGLSVKVSGYSDKLDTLMETVVDALNSPLNDVALFDRLKRATKEELSNSLKDKPYNRTFAALYQELLPGWSVEDQLSALEKLTLNDVLDQRDSLLNEGELRLFTHGNLTKEQASSLTNKLIKAFTSMKPLKVARLSAKTVPEGDLFTQAAVKHTDNALLLYLQSDDDSSRADAEVILLNEILSTPFYTQLRTEQQLGYIVFSNYLPIADRPGIALVVQSPSANSEELQTAYKQFIAAWRQQLPSKLEAEIEDFKASVRARIASPSKRLSEETARLWREIDRDNSQFDSKEKLLKAVNQVNSEDLIKRIDQLLNHKLWIATVSS